MSRLIDMAGKRIGMLTVLGYAGSKFPGRASRASWHCRCACGTEVVVTGAHLREGSMQSCGCATKFKARENRR